MQAKKLLFIHHSTGANLIREGRVRELLKEKAPNIEFWDHSYNLVLPKFYKLTSKLIWHHSGLSDNLGNLTGKDYQIQITNTDPEGFADLFTQPITNPPDNALSKILSSFDVIMFKSCFPVTKIESDEKLEHYKNCYLKIKDRISNLTDKTFIIFTPPPLRKEMTKPEYSTRARAFANWLGSKEYLQNTTSIKVFDFFDQLAGVDNTLKRSYCRILIPDSHPNKLANQEVGVKLVEFLASNLE